MGQTDVDLVRQWIEHWDLDLKAWANDDEIDADLRTRIEPLMAAEFEMLENPGLVTLGMPRHRTGWDELRDAYRAATEPFESYHEHAEDIRDLGEGRVLSLGEGIGTTRDGGVDVKLAGGASFTVRDGRITRIEFFNSREEALAAAGLES